MRDFDEVIVGIKHLLLVGRPTSDNENYTYFLIDFLIEF